MTSLWRHLCPNYNTLDFKILTQCVKLLGERVLQVWWWYLHWFRRYRKKTRGGARNSPPPPSGARVKLQVPLHVRTCTPLFCISATTGPIGLKFCTQSGIPQLVMVHTLNFRCHCTCARAHPFFVSRKLLGRLGWKLAYSQVHHSC